MNVAKARFIGLGITRMCRAVESRRSPEGRVRDVSCNRRTRIEVGGWPLCREHRRMVPDIYVSDDNGRIIPFEETET